MNSTRYWSRLRYTSRALGDITSANMRAPSRPGIGSRWNTASVTFVRMKSERTTHVAPGPDPRPIATRTPATTASTRFTTGPAIDTTTTSRGYRRRFDVSSGSGLAYANGGNRYPAAHSTTS